MEANALHSIARSQPFSFENPIQKIINNISENDQIIIKIAENLQLVKKNPSQINSQWEQGKYISSYTEKALKIYKFFKFTSNDDLVKKNHKQVLFDAITKKVNADLKLNELASLAYMLEFLHLSPEIPKEMVYQRVTEQLDSEREWDNLENPSDYAWVTYALRDVKTKNKSFFYEHFRSNIQRNVNNLTPFQISLVVRGFKTAGFESPPLLNSLRNITISNSNNLKIDEIVRTLRAFAYSKQGKKEDCELNLETIQIFQPTLIDKMDELSVKKAIRISRIFAEMNIVDTNLFNAIWNKIEPNIGILTAEQLTFITKSFCNTDQNNNPILLKILNAIVNKHNENENYFDMWALSKITYATLIKFCNNDENFDYYKDFIHYMLIHFSKTKPSDWVSKTKPSDWDKESLSRLRTIVEIYKEKFKGSDRDMIHRLENLTSLLPCDNPPTSSYLHRDVMHHLEELLYDKGSSSKMESEYPFFGFYLDIAFYKEKLAIEIDGRCHLDETGQYMPKNILKETLLELKGWEFVRIKHSDWPGGGSDDLDQQKRDFLLRKVKHYFYFEDQEDECDPVSERYCVAQAQINYNLRERDKPKHLKKILQKFEKPPFGKGG